MIYFAAFTIIPLLVLIIVLCGVVFVFERLFDPD